MPVQSKSGDLWLRQGIAEAQYNLGIMHDLGQGIPHDYAEAVKWLQLAAEQGSANAQNYLGAMYDEGKGVSQNYAEAVKWYRLAAEQGVADAQFNLGRVYADGLGVLQDYAEAVKWWILAAEQGYIDSSKQSWSYVPTWSWRVAKQCKVSHVVQHRFRQWPFSSW